MDADERRFFAAAKPPYVFSVAQTSSLLYRGFPTRRRCGHFAALELATRCRLEIDDTAGWKPALRGHSLWIAFLRRQIALTE